MTLPEAFLWAVWAAEGSDYLEKLDAATHPGSSAYVPPTNTHPDLVDISHVRWATGNAITAIDLCAATMGRLFCGSTGPNELDLRDFDRRANRRRRDPARWPILSTAMKWVCGQPASNPSLDADSLRLSLPTAFLDWVKDTLPPYKELQKARNSLTHSSLPRIPTGVEYHLGIGLTSKCEALGIRLPANWLKTHRR
jgi:hypothetical protein